MLNTLNGLSKVPATTLSLCLSHCCCRVAQNLHLQAFGNHPTILHLTTVHYNLFLHTSSCTGRAGCARTLKSCTMASWWATRKSMAHNMQLTRTKCGWKVPCVLWELQTTGSGNFRLQDPNPIHKTMPIAAARTYDFECAKSPEKNTRGRGSETAHPIETFGLCVADGHSGHQPALKWVVRSSPSLLGSIGQPFRCRSKHFSALLWNPLQEGAAHQKCLLFT